MNPGNGIETPIFLGVSNLCRCFLFMNPGNGIETSILVLMSGITMLFLIYESRQRD